MEVDLSTLRALASQQFGAMRITTPVEDFHADVSLAHVGDIHLFDMHTHPHTVDRNASFIKPTDPPTYKLSLQIEGKSSLTHYDREALLEPGMLAIYNSHVPYVLHYPGTQRSLIMQFPAEYVLVPPSAMKRITALPITKDDRLGKVAIPLFEQLAINFEVLEGPHAGSLLRSAIDMLIAVFSEELSSDGPRFRTWSNALLSLSTRTCPTPIWVRRRSLMRYLFLCAIFTVSLLPPVNRLATTSNKLDWNASAEIWPIPTPQMFPSEKSANDTAS